MLDPEEMNPKEMMRLREMLISAGVRYITDDEGDHWRMFSPDFETMPERECVRGFSVILSPYSYGCEDGLLEAWVQGMDEPKGWMDAYGVIGLLREAGVVG